MITIANTSQLPKADYLAVQHSDADKALAELKYIAEKKGVKLGEVYTWGKVYFYAEVVHG